MEIELEEPEWYMERFSRGCILDPSVFYSVDHIAAISNAVSTIQPSEVLLPSAIYDAITERQWLRFLETLILWSARYEEIPDAWRLGQRLVRELNIKRIPELKPDDAANELARILEIEEQARPFDRIILELTASSLQNSYPVLACEAASFRLIELLKSRLNAIVVEPGGRWVARKREVMRRPGGIALLSLKLAGAALLFVGVAGPVGYAGGGITITITVIDG